MLRTSVRAHTVDSAIVWSLAAPVLIHAACADSEQLMVWRALLECYDEQRGTIRLDGGAFFSGSAFDLASFKAGSQMEQNLSSSLVMWHAA